MLLSGRTEADSLVPLENEKRFVRTRVLMERRQQRRHCHEGSVPIITLRPPALWFHAAGGWTGVDGRDYAMDCEQKLQLE